MIDVIIPVYQPTEKFMMLLRAVEAQTLKAKRMILMHTEDGQDLSKAIDAVRTIPVEEIMVKKEEFDHGKTRDAAIRLSDADYVVLMTQDAIPVNAYLFENLVKEMEQDEEVAVAYARQVAPKDSGLVETYTRMFNYPDKGRVKSKKDREELGIKTYFCSNVCAAYRKEAYLILGGFEKNIIFNEDMVFAATAIHAGYKIAYEAKALVWHAHDYSGMQQLKRNFDIGVSQACYPEIFENVKSETEGIRLIKNTAIYLLKSKKPFLIVKLIYHSFCKYMGFRLGRNYKVLPDAWISMLTINPEYWKKRGDTSG